MSANGKARRPYRKASEYVAKGSAYKQQQHVTNPQQQQQQQVSNQQQHISNQQRHISNQQQHASNQQQHITNQQQHISNQQQQQQHISNQQQQRISNQQQHITNQQQQHINNQQHHASRSHVPQLHIDPSPQQVSVKQERNNHNPEFSTTNYASQTDLEMEIGMLRKKLASLSHKLEHAECEFLQTREYLQNQVDISNDRFQRMNEQYKKLQTSYTSLLSTNRQLEGKLSKVESLEREKSQMMKEIGHLNSKLSDSRNALLKTQEENERLRKDCNLAVQLLKCNQGTYQTQKLSQLPDDVQEKISSYKMEIQDYNEYINPYGDSESDSETENHPRHFRSSVPPRSGNMNEEIPVELLAKVLKKTENVHMNLEDSDYINDPQLTATYKGRYGERKLIKPDYNSEKLSNTQLNSGNSSTTPWAKATSSQSADSSSSPWELAPSHRRVMQNVEDDDDSAVGAYGAYPVGSKRRHPPSRAVNQRPHPTAAKTLPPMPLKSNDDFKMLPRRPPSPDELEFRAPLPPSSQGVASYFSRSTSNKSSPSISSSSSSRKQSPLKVSGKEAGRKEELSSLLNQEDSDEEEVNHVNILNSPKKKYLLKSDVDYEDSGTLLRMTQDEDEEEDHNPQEIDLEWDPTLRSPPALPLDEEENKDEENKAEIIIEKQEPTEPDLLLSYSHVEEQNDPQQSLASDLEGLLISGHEDLQENSSPVKDEIPSTGNLLTQIMNSKPSVENFLLSTPPPPQAFASSSNPLEEEIENSLSSIQKTDVLDVVDIDESRTNITKESQGTGSKVEVLNLEEEPRHRQVYRRRDSLDHAQEFGNVLDNETNV